MTSLVESEPMPNVYPTGISVLARLRTLGLFEGADLPADFGELVQLESLSNNEIGVRYSGSGSRLAALTDISLRWGSVSDGLPFDWIGEVPNLRLLELTGEYQGTLSDLPASFSSLTRLERLDLGESGSCHNNDFTSIPVEVRSMSA